MSRKIVCAAIRCKITGFVVPSVRHWDRTMREVVRQLRTVRRVNDWEQGFIDNKEQFVDRVEGLKIAQESLFRGTIKFIRN